MFQEIEGGGGHRLEHGGWSGNWLKLRGAKPFSGGPIKPLKKSCLPPSLVSEREQNTRMYITSSPVKYTRTLPPPPASTPQWSINPPLVSESDHTLVSRPRHDRSLWFLVEDGLSTGHHLSLDQLLSFLHLLTSMWTY